MEDNKYHPCQGMADAMTLWEYLGKDLRGRKLAVSWTYSPSTKKPIAPHHDFMYAASYFGPDIVFAHPAEMRIDPDVEAAIKANVELNGGSYSVVDNMEDACESADVVYAKNYVCLDLLPPVTTEPKHDEMAELFDKYRGWIADEKRMRMAKDSAFYMHCLPCERGYEVSDAVLDDPKWGTRCYDEAENRLHAQKGVMAASSRKDEDGRRLAGVRRTGSGNESREDTGPGEVLLGRGRDQGRSGDARRCA